MANKLTSDKAKEILHDKSVHGHPLTDKQRRFFGAIAGGAPIKAEAGGWLDKYEQGGLVLKKKTKDNYDLKANPNDVKASVGPGFVGLGYGASNWKSPAWGGQFAMGGALPGSVGFMYARTQNPAPANGKYTKKTLASAQAGIVMPEAELTPDIPKSKISTAIKSGTQDPTATNLETDSFGQAYSKARKQGKTKFSYQGKDYSTKYKGTPEEQLKQTGITDAQLHDRNIIQDQLAKNLFPIGYDKLNVLGSLFTKNSDRKTLEDQIRTNTDYYEWTAEDAKRRLDAFNLYSGLPQKHGTFSVSKNKPSISKNKDDIYYSITNDKLRKLLADKITTYDLNAQKDIPAQFKENDQSIQYVPGAKNKIILDDKSGVMGNFTASLGKDDQGDYVSYYDKWDIAPKDFGKPMEIYDKIYLKDLIKDYKPKMQNGGEMAFYQNGLDFKPKSISKKGKKIIKDDMGQWAHPGEVTEISSPDITMQGVDYPVLGISDTGHTQMMYPDQDYKFDGKKVTEFPMMQKGGWLDKYSPIINDQIPSTASVHKKIIDAENDRQRRAIQKKIEDQGSIKQAGPAQSTASKAWNVMAHPMTALSYKTHGKDIPEHFERGEQNILENAVNIVNPFSLVDAVASIPSDVKHGNYLQAGLNALTALPMLAEARGTGRQIARTLKADREAAKDVLGEFATIQPEAKSLASEVSGSQPLYNPITGEALTYDKSGNVISSSKKLTADEIRANNQKLLDKSKFRTGATPPPPEGLAPYQVWDTDIDWGKWNPEIPQNEKLMQEYINIENTTKREGTWMKNPDGSKFAGTPEQFIQSRSENFKKAFPQGADITYRGDNEHYPELRPKASRWYGDPIFTGNKNLASYYTAKGPKAGYFTPFEPTAAERLQDFVSKKYPDLTVQQYVEQHPYVSSGIMATEDAGIHELAIPKTKNAIELDAKGNWWGGLEDPEMRAKIEESGIERSVDTRDKPNLFSTDDVAQYIKKQGIDRALIRNVDDGTLGHVLIHNQRPGQYAKSLRGNSGMFDMNNPNVYAGFPNPLDIADELTPRLDPLKLLGVQGDIMEFSPLNLVPGYGKKLAGKNQTFRKFGNSIQDVIERQALSPKGGSPFRMGRDQIVKEGNWAARGEPNEGYGGVFEATFDLNNPEANLSASGSANRNGVLMMDKAGNRLPDIPLTEPGMSFNRRLPFSTRYVPIDKQKLINNQFQFATMAPRYKVLLRNMD